MTDLPVGATRRWASRRPITAAKVQTSGYTTSLIADVLALLIQNAVLPIVTLVGIWLWPVRPRL